MFWRLCLSFSIVFRRKPWLLSISQLCLRLYHRTGPHHQIQANLSLVSWSLSFAICFSSLKIFSPGNFFLDRTALVERKLFPVGPAYLAHVRRKVHDLTFEAHDKHEEERNRLASGSSSDEIIDDLGVGDEEEDEDLLSLDPKEWKVRPPQPVSETRVPILTHITKQRNKTTMRSSDSHISGIKPPKNRSKSPVRNPSCDSSVSSNSNCIPFTCHIKTLALPEYRFIVDRKKVLKHHPDKKATIAGETNDDAFFKCIQKAMDVLTNPERRRQFDSVDPHYLSLEEDVPTAAELKGKDYNAFFEAFAPVFEREARFSKVQPVPLLSPYDAPKDVVEGFYHFWYNFDSWRSFEYLDKEINEGSDKYGSIYYFRVPRN